MWILQEIVLDSNNEVRYKIIKEGNIKEISLYEAIKLFENNRLVNALPIQQGLKIVAFKLIGNTDEKYNITFRGYDKYEGVKSPGEVAKMYIQKYSILNREPPLQLKILSDSDVVLEKVNTKNTWGTLEIPWFVTQIKIPKNTENQHFKSLREDDTVLGKCKFSEIIINNQKGRPLAINYLCAWMESVKIALKIKHPECICGIQHLFYNQTNLIEIDIDGIKFSTGQANSMFENCIYLKKVKFGKDDFIYPLSTAQMFCRCNELINFEHIFKHIDFKYIKNQSNMFKDCYKLKTFDFQEFRLSNLSTAKSMFKGCSQLSSVNQRVAHLPYLKDATQMFSGCTKLEEFDFQKIHMPAVEYLNYTFSSCSNIREINLSGLEFRHLYEANYTFIYCQRLKSINFDNTSFPVLKQMRDTFQQCHLLIIVDFKNQKLPQLKDIQGIIDKCRYIVYFDMIDAHAPNINCINLQFQNCPKLKAVRLQDSTKNITDAQLAFSNDPSLIVVWAKGLDLISSNQYKMFEKQVNIKQIQTSTIQLSKQKWKDLCLPNKEIKQLRIG